ncbi:MAG: K+/H+ antiporter subunit F [Geminicoccaceae bacterium]|nr:K+/H+ antiporter subunit F [Geminicoccaceae bacterium]
MIDLALLYGFIALALALLCTAWRLSFGPTMADRILALDTMVIDTLALIVLYGIHHGRSVLFEAAILIAMVGFISTVAYAKFVLRGDIIE